MAAPGTRSRSRRKSGCRGRKEQYYRTAGFAARHDSPRTIVQYVAEVKKPDGERLPGFHDAQLESLRFRMFSPAPIYPGMEIARMTGSPASWTLRSSGPTIRSSRWCCAAALRSRRRRSWSTARKLADPAVRKKLVEGGEAAVAASTDPMIVLARNLDPLRREMIKWMEDNVESVEQRAGEQIGKARFAVYGKSTYPDATFTLRLSYGQVQGLSDERHQGARQDHVLRALRPRGQFQLRRRRSTCRRVITRPRQTGPGDAAELRHHQRHHRRQFGIARDQSPRRNRGADFRRQHRIAGGRFCLRQRQESRRRGAHGGMTEALRKLYNAPGPGE